jgi:hypothetical protein
MKLTPLAWLLCVVAAGVTDSAGLDRNAFTFTHYNLSVRIEPEQQRLAVRGKITLRNDSNAAQKNAVLQISSSLGWRSIQIAGKPVQFVSQTYTSDVDHTGALSEAIISLPQAVPVNQTVDVEVGYEGTIRLDTTRLNRIGVPQEIARHNDWDRISPSFSGVRGAGYVAWYPVAMDAASLSEEDTVFEVLGKWKARAKATTMDFELCVDSRADSSATVIMDGLATQENEDSCRSYKFAGLGVTVPLFVAGAYSTEDSKLAEVYYLGSNKDAGHKYIGAAETVLPSFAAWFGAPRSKVKVVELPDPDAAPFETGTLLLTPFTSDKNFAKITVVHELTHAAFPSLRPWVFEGVAHFAQALWREQEAGRAAALDYMGIHRSAVVEAENRIQPKGDHPLISTSYEEFYRSKAMFVWWMLRDMLGDDALKQALKAYRSEDDKDASYVQKLVQVAGKRDLQWFFDDWVYQDRGLPDFRALSVYPRAMDSGIYVVTVSVENLGGAGAEVPVTVRMQTGEVTKRLQVRAKSTASIRIEVPSQPREIVVNDGSVPETDMRNNTFKIEGSR